MLAPAITRSSFYFILMSGMYNAMCNGIASGLSYIDALRMLRQTGKCTMSANSVFMHAGIISGVGKQYFSIEDPGIQQTLYSLCGVLFTGQNNEQITNVENQVYTVYTQSLDFFK